MYLYFDKTGVLKEIINDESLRQGNYGINEINVYIEGVEYTSIDVSYLLPSSSIVGPSNYDDFVSKEIPFDRKRDLRYFQYHKEYSFLVIPIEAVEIETDTYGPSPLDETGTVHCEMTAMISATSQLKLGDVNFYVEEDPVLQQHYVAEQNYLDLANYQFLRSLIQEYHDGFVPYTGANANVNLGDYYITAFSFTARQENFSIIIGANEDVEPTIFVTDNNGEFYYNFPNEPIDEEYSFTIATQEWVSAQGFVPYADATSNVDLNGHTLTASQVILEQDHNITRFDLQQNGTLRIYNFDSDGLEYIFDFPISGEEEDTYTIATREWATSQFLTETAGDAKYLPLTGGELSGSILVKNPNQSFNYIGMSREFTQGTRVIYISEYNLDITNPSPMLYMADTTSQNKGLILDNDGFKVGDKNVLSKQYKLLFPRDETDNANKTLATREWVDSNKSIWVHEYTLTGIYHNTLTTIVLKLPSEEEITTLSDLFDAIDLYGYHEKILSTNTIPTSNTGRYYDLLKGDAAVSGKFYYGTSEIAEMSLLRKTKIF